MNWYSRICIILLAAGTAFTAGCEKSEPLSDRQTQISVMQFSRTAAATSVLIGGNPVSENPLAFGQTTGTAENPYILTGSGFRQISVQPSTGTVFPSYNTILPESGYLSLIIFDTSGTSGITAPAVLTLKDPLSTDTARMHFRFFQLATNTDTLTARVVNTVDTIVIANRALRPTVGANNTSLANFVAAGLNNGSYSVEILDKNDQVVAVSGPHDLQKGAWYTICTAGNYDPNLVPPFSVFFIRNR